MNYHAIQAVLIAQTPAITPEQAVALAKKMLAACEGGTLCSFGKLAALSAMCDSLPVEAAQAVNVYLTQLKG